MKPIRKYYNNGQIYIESWRVNNNFHRLNGPAYQWWYENGQLRIKGWWVDGEYHRLNGPAYQFWNENGQLLYEAWYFKGIKYEKEEHLFNIFREEHGLSEVYEEWPKDMKVLFEMAYK